MRGLVGIETVCVGSWREGCDDGGEDGIRADDASSAEQQWDLPADGIENEDDEAVRKRESCVCVRDPIEDVQDVGDGADSTVDTLDKQCLAVTQAKSLVHGWTEVVDDCPYSEQRDLKEANTAVVTYR